MCNQATIRNRKITIRDKAKIIRRRIQKRYLAAEMDCYNLAILNRFLGLVGVRDGKNGGDRLPFNPFL